MKPLIEKLPLSENTSFVARTHRTPKFEVSWHQHEEFELILFTEGEGLSFIGNYVGSFTVGDVFFLGANLPHTFQKSYPELVTSAIVIHFKQDFWGDKLLQLPESSAVLKTMQLASLGLKISGAVKEKLTALIKELEFEKGFRRLLLLGECLAALENSTSYTTLSTQEIHQPFAKDKDRIDRIFNYAMEHFLEPIDLSVVAGMIGLTVPAFCSYFKKRTRKTYVSFVNEIRIGFACKLLDTTESSIAEISYESGYSSIAHFNRTFSKIKKMTPTAFRRRVTI